MLSSRMSPRVSRPHHMVEGVGLGSSKDKMSKKRPKSDTKELWAKHSGCQEPFGKVSNLHERTKKVSSKKTLRIHGKQTNKKEKKIRMWVSNPPLSPCTSAPLATRPFGLGASAAPKIRVSIPTEVPLLINHITKSVTTPLLPFTHVRVSTHGVTKGSTIAPVVGKNFIAKRNKREAKSTPQTESDVFLPS